MLLLLLSRSVDSVRPHRRQPTGLPSLGFSREEHRGGLPLPPPVEVLGRQNQQISTFPVDLLSGPDCTELLGRGSRRGPRGRTLPAGRHGHVLAWWTGEASLRCESGQREGNGGLAPNTRETLARDLKKSVSTCQGTISFFIVFLLHSSSCKLHEDMSVES